jgi:hypothetical protein
MKCVRHAARTKVGISYTILITKAQQRDDVLELEVHVKSILKLTSDK